MFCFYKFLIHEEDDQRKREVFVFWVTFGNYFLISRTFVHISCFVVKWTRVSSKVPYENL